MLSVRDLKLAIHGTPVLKGLSFDLAPGEALGLVGESGSGKSMTALSLMRLLPHGAQLSGAMDFGTEDLSTAPERRMQALRGAEIGMVFQEPMSALNPLMPVGAQVEEAIRLHRPSADAPALAQEALTRAGLPPDRFPPSRYPHDLSGGQRQRVVIAIATALRPRLLIADEPTTALDVSTQAVILDLLRRLAAEDGCGLILITHDLAVAARMCNRIAIMKAGEIVESGPVPDVFHGLRHPYSRALLAASTHRPARPDRATGPEILRVEGATRSHPLPRRSLLSKRARFTAVDRVSLALREGENVGLVGESGCGKSTLARAILALEPLQGGTVHLTGAPFHPGADAPALRARIQAVFQDPYGSFNPRWTVGDLVAEPLHLASPRPSRTEGRKRAEAMLEQVGLRAEDATKRPHEFSGGQRQRIAIARALIAEPKLVVLDEAVSALDVSVRARVLDLLAGLSARLGLSYLFISHDLHVVRAICDRVLVMQAGKIVEEAETEALFRAPKTAYARALLAATPDLETELAARAAAPA